MPLSPITFASGHQLVDNGAGDYCLQCPDGHEQRPTVFPHQVSSFIRHPERWECIRCKSPLGECTSGQEYKPELVDHWACKHVAMEILSDKRTKLEGATERLVRFRCAKCGATIESTEYFYPNQDAPPPLEER